MRGQGYGFDWKNWDDFINYEFPRPNDVCYGNWQPFLTPKGKWFAFYNTSYSDIRVINLETKEIIVENFYSYKFPDGKHLYAHHTNWSTYVPHYLSYDHTFKDGRITRVITLDSSCSEERNDFDPSNPNAFFDKASKDDSDIELKSLPFAFNAWTVWAGDYEFYVDILDLSRIDEGIIKSYNEKKTSFIIPREAFNVRNFVKIYILEGFIEKDSPKYEKNAVHASFSILEETKHHSYRKDKLNNVFMEYNGNDPDNVYSLEEKLPWKNIED